MHIDWKLFWEACLKPERRETDMNMLPKTANIYYARAVTAHTIWKLRYYGLVAVGMHPVERRPEHITAIRANGGTKVLAYVLPNSYRTDKVTLPPGGFEEAQRKLVTDNAWELYADGKPVTYFDSRIGLIDVRRAYEEGYAEALIQLLSGHIPQERIDGLYLDNCWPAVPSNLRQANPLMEIDDPDWGANMALICERLKHAFPGWLIGSNGNNWQFADRLNGTTLENFPKMHRPQWLVENQGLLDGLKTYSRPHATIINCGNAQELAFATATALLTDSYLSYDRGTRHNTLYAVPQLMVGTPTTEIIRLAMTNSIQDPRPIYTRRFFNSETAEDFMVVCNFNDRAARFTKRGLGIIREADNMFSKVKTGAMFVWMPGKSGTVFEVRGG